jgi:hypothetical protein
VEQFLDERGRRLFAANDVDHALTLASWRRAAPSKFAILFLRS